MWQAITLKKVIPTLEMTAFMVLLVQHQIFKTFPASLRKVTDSTQATAHDLNNTLRGTWGLHHECSNYDLSS